MDANAALALALRLEALERQVSACGSDETLPLESRVAQLSLAIDKATEPHASLQKLLKEACCIDDTLQAPNADETLLDPQSKLALVLDHDTRMRSFVAQMEACERLNDQGVAGAGRLATHESLQERLHVCAEQQKQHMHELDIMQRHITELATQYERYTDQLSHIFIALDKSIRKIEAAAMS
ncbi:dynactin complex protein [Malassezia pachydermatis]